VLSLGRYYYTVIYSSILQKVPIYERLCFIISEKHFHIVDNSASFPGIPQSLSLSTAQTVIPFLNRVWSIGAILDMAVFLHTDYVEKILPDGVKFLSS